MGDALHTHGGVVSAQEARLADAGLLAVQGPSLLDVRTGVLVGPGSTGLVTGTASAAPMQVAVAPHQWVTSRGSANGPYRGSLDATQLVTIAAAPASGSRIDVVYVKQQDSQPGIPTPDATTAPLYGVVQGVETTGTPAKPALPLGATELATVQVNAGATATNGAGVTITNTARQTAARGAPIPVGTIAERDALPKYPGAQAVLYAAATGFPAGTLFICDGAAWHSIARDDDSGWVLASTVASVGAGWNVSGLYVRRRAGHLTVTGTCARANWADGAVILTLDAGWRPTSSPIGIEMTGRRGTTGRDIVTLFANGDLRIYGANPSGALGTSFNVVAAPVPLD